MALVAYYDLELYQKDEKTTFLNRDLLQEKFYMAQSNGLVMEGKERLECHEKKSILWIKTSL